MAERDKEKDERRAEATLNHLNLYLEHRHIKLYKNDVYINK
jgi:hypothetical protein